MPTYAYRCTQCNEAFDVYQRFDDLTVCPACSRAVTKAVFAHRHRVQGWRLLPHGFSRRRNESGHALEEIHELRLVHVVVPHASERLGIHRSRRRTVPVSTGVDATDDARASLWGMTVHPRPAWRRALYRFRHLIAAAAVLAGILVVVGTLAPGTTAYALRDGAQAGTILTTADLAQVRVPHNALPADHFSAPPVGEQLLIDLPAHTVLSTHLVTPGILGGWCPGRHTRVSH